MVRAVDTRWNSFVEAVARAIYLKDALKKLFAMSKYNKAGPEGLLNFKLPEDEWVLLTQLHKLLKVRHLMLCFMLYAVRPLLTHYIISHSFSQRREFQSRLSRSFMSRWQQSDQSNLQGGCEV